MDIRTNTGHTCLHAAARRGSLSVVDQLLAAGAGEDLEYHAGDGATVLCSAVRGILQWQVDTWTAGDSAAKEAAERTAGATVVVRRLLAEGANPSQHFGELGPTPLHIAAQGGPLTPFDGIVAALLEAGANPEEPDNRGMTPVDTAALQASLRPNHAPTLEMLRAAAANR